VCMYAPAARLPALAHVHCGVLPRVCVRCHSERYGILRRLYTRLAKYLCEQYTVTQGRQSGKRLMPKVAFNYVRTFVNMCRDHMSENTHLSKGTCACACARVCCLLVLHSVTSTPQWIRWCTCAFPVYMCICMCMCVHLYTCVCFACTCSFFPVHYTLLEARPHCVSLFQETLPVLKSQRSHWR
jgi:hypothetical protein